MCVLLMTEIQYRPYLESDRTAVQALFEASFGTHRDDCQWAWEYEDPCFKSIVALADESGNIVGHYAVLPRVLIKDGKRIGAGLVVDVMTHPSYGRRGIFVNCARQAFSMAKDAGISLLIGFPNDAAIRGHLKVGWAEVGYLRVYARPLRVKKLLDVMGIGGVIPKGIVDFVDGLTDVIWRSLIGSTGQCDELNHMSITDFLRLGPQIEELSVRSIARGKISLTRQIDWLSWRLRDPTGIHEVIVARQDNAKAISGYAILKFREWKGLRLCVILDIAVDGRDRDTSTRLMREAIRESISRKCDACLILGNPSAFHKRWFRRMMILPVPKRLRLIVKSLSEANVPADYLNIRNWHIEFLDHDVL